MKELWNSIVGIYENYTGNSKLVVLFLVAVLVIYLINNSKENEETGIDGNVNPGLFLLSIPAGIAYALTCIYTRLRNKSMGASYRIIVCVLIPLVLILSGTRVFSDDKFTAADNTMHIPAEYLCVMDRLLQEEDGMVRVIASPEVNKYFKMYSSRFDTFYDYPANGDLSLLGSDERYVYEQLKLSTPDESAVVRIMRQHGYNYIVYDSNTNYFELPLEEYGLTLVDIVDDFKIYSYAGGSEP